MPPGQAGPHPSQLVGGHEIFSQLLRTAQGIVEEILLHTCTQGKDKRHTPDASMSLHSRLIMSLPRRKGTATNTSNTVPIAKHQNQMGKIMDPKPQNNHNQYPQGCTVPAWHPRLGLVDCPAPSIFGTLQHCSHPVPAQGQAAKKTVQRLSESKLSISHLVLFVNYDQCSGAKHTHPPSVSMAFNGSTLPARRCALGRVPRLPSVSHRA